MSIDELKSTLATEIRSVACEIEKGMIQRFVQAIDDSNPLWQVTAPPTLLLTMGIEQIQQLFTSSSSETFLLGSTELECYQPVKPGDVLTVASEITNIRERQGQMGKTAFITFNSSFKNQRQELVAKCRQMIITY
ncbi:MaoC family dehydratase N-terminal domain-containing protein [Chloroflexota bacterium]